MHPPSYYTSLANSNPSTSSSYRSSNSTSSQFRSTFSTNSPSSSAYVTRTHLPYVSQSMLVAHCITGVGSSTRPYGQQQQQQSPSSSFPSSTSSSISSLSSGYSSGSGYNHRPSSTKRHQLSTSSKNPYLNPSPSSSSFSSYRSSTASSYNNNNSSNYLSPYYSSSTSYPSSSSSYSTTNSYYSRGSNYRSSTGYSKPLSSYYQPIRLRERPLLTQISSQINNNKQRERDRDTITTTVIDDKKKIDSRLDEKSEEQQQTKDKSLGVQRKEEDEIWSSDVARNISRNKYLIKFREFDKRQSISPIPLQLTDDKPEELVQQQQTNELKLIDSFETETQIVKAEDCLIKSENSIKTIGKPKLIKQTNKKLANNNKKTDLLLKKDKTINKEDKMRIPIQTNTELLKPKANSVIDKTSISDDSKSKVNLIINDDKTNKLVTKIINKKDSLQIASKTAIKQKDIVVNSTSIVDNSKDPKKLVSSVDNNKLLSCDKIEKTTSKKTDIVIKNIDEEKKISPSNDSNLNKESKEQVREKRNIKLRIKNVNNKINEDINDKKLLTDNDNNLTNKTSIPTIDLKEKKELKLKINVEKQLIDKKENDEKLVIKENESIETETENKDKTITTTTTAKTKTPPTPTKTKVKKLVKTGSKTKLSTDDTVNKETKPKRKVLANKQQQQQQKSDSVEVVEIKKDDNKLKLNIKKEGKVEDSKLNDGENNNSCGIIKTIIQPPTPPNSSRQLATNNNKRIRFREYHLEDFNFLSVLGHGGWGFVILAELKEHDACFAVKCIKKITIVEDDDFDSIMIERKVLTLGNVHPFICKLFCTFETDGYLFFVMEYCAGGDLMFHVQREGKFTEPRCRFYAAEIICAIRFLHNRHIIYRDLKLDNILLDSRGHVRLVDFGMCQCRTYREEMLPSNFCGTPEYISPEIIKGVPYNHSVDWWSFGVLLYEMAVGKMPFRGNDENELLWNVCYEQIHYPMFLTRELTILLQLLLEREPTKRMGMSTCKSGDIYDQPWFRGTDWKAFEEMRVPPPFVPEVTSKRDVQNFDADFTESAPELSPVDESTLKRIDQSQFQKFPYTNPDISIFDQN